MMSAPSCSIRRFVSLIAVSALSFEQPTPTSLSGWPLIEPPVQPSRGLFGFFALRAGELRHRRHDAGEILVVERAEGALTVGQDADLDRRRRRVRAVAVAATSAAATTASAASGTSFHLRLRAFILMPSSFRTGWMAADRHLGES